MNARRPSGAPEPEPDSGVFARDPADCWATAATLLGDGPREILDAGIGDGEPGAALAAAGHRVTRLAGDEGASCWTSLHGPVPLLDETFDVIVLAEGLEHLPDLDAAFAELRRLLVPEGALVVSRPRAAEPHTGARLPRCSAEDLARAMIRAGLAVEGVRVRAEDEVVVARRDERWGPALAEAARLAVTDPVAASEALAALDVGALPPEIRREVFLVGARVMLAVGSREGALELASGADRVDPRAAGPLLGLAEVAAALGDRATALEACFEACRRAPDSPAAWQALAGACEAAGEPGSAAEAMDRALGAGPADRGIVRAALALARRQGLAPRAAELEARASALDERAAA